LVNCVQGKAKIYFYFFDITDNKCGNNLGTFSCLCHVWYQINCLTECESVSQSHMCAYMWVVHIPPLLQFWRQISLQCNFYRSQFLPSHWKSGLSKAKKALHSLNHILIVWNFPSISLSLNKPPFFSHTLIYIHRFSFDCLLRFCSLLLTFSSVLFLFLIIRAKTTLPEIFFLFRKSVPFLWLVLLLILILLQFLQKLSLSGFRHNFLP